MTYTVNMMAIPVITVVGGACCIPMAWRVIDSTTAIFTKLVTIMPTKGKSASPAIAVIKINGRLEIESPPKRSAPPTMACRSLLGLPRAAWAMVGASPTKKKRKAVQPMRLDQRTKVRSGAAAGKAARHRCLRVGFMMMRSPSQPLRSSLLLPWRSLVDRRQPALCRTTRLAPV